jgi:IMP cyclohydrolase
MKMIDIKNDLSSNEYPGRGIVIGRNDDKAYIAYFIMGRSENSRNRVFVESKAGIKTKAFDESKLVDPSLIIYSPVRVLDNHTIVTNGDQTDTIFEFLNDGSKFEKALRSREFEPDEPNFTPRISGIVTLENEDFSYRLSVLKSANGNADSCQRFFFEYSNPINGMGHFIHTYKCDGNPIPSFEGEPKMVSISGDIEEFSNDIWTSLNSENKVSLFTRIIDLKTGAIVSKIINKNV